MSRAAHPSGLSECPGPSPSRYFKDLPEITLLTAMHHIRFALSLRTLKDLLHEHEHGIEISHDAVRRW